jgi:hypothetical protein
VPRSAAVRALPAKDEHTAEAGKDAIAGHRFAGVFEIEVALNGAPM